MKSVIIYGDLLNYKFLWINMYAFFFLKRGTLDTSFIKSSYQRVTWSNVQEQFIILKNIHNTILKNTGLQSLKNQIPCL